MEGITTYDIFDCFGIESPMLFDKKLRTKDDLLRVIRFCISVCELFTEEEET